MYLYSHIHAMKECVQDFISIYIKSVPQRNSLGMQGVLFYLPFSILRIEDVESVPTVTQNARKDF